MLLFTFYAPDTLPSKIDSRREQARVASGGFHRQSLLGLRSDRVTGMHAWAVIHEGVS